MAKINIIFRSEETPNGQEQVFVEVNDEHGKSINAGEWSADGEYEALTIDLEMLNSMLEGGQ